MDYMAQVTSKGQITIPKPVREALGIDAGTQILFRVDGDHAVLIATPNLIDLAGIVPVPPDKRGLSWKEIRRQAHEAWAREAMKGLEDE